MYDIHAALKIYIFRTFDEVKFLQPIKDIDVQALAKSSNNYRISFSLPEMWFCNNSDEYAFLSMFGSMLQRLRIQNFEKVDSDVLKNYFLSVFFLKDLISK